MLKNILLIDDDSDEADIFQEVIESIRPLARFTAVKNCKKAIDQIKKAIIPIPNLIFLDIQMPVFNGWDCLKQLKEDRQLNQVPVIVYSNSSFEKDQSLAAHLGAMAFWTKPNKFAELRNRLENLMKNLWPVRNQRRR